MIIVERRLVMKSSTATQLDSTPSFENPNFKRENFKVKEIRPNKGYSEPDKSVERAVECLNSLLANEFTVFTKTLNFHWNVTGPRFHSIHQFLDDQYHDLLKIVDDVAERIRKIGGNPIGTLTEMKKGNSLIERPGVQPDTSNMIADMMSDHESIQSQIKTILIEIEQRPENDPGTEDFLTSLLKKHEEMAWMLKAHIEK